MTHEPRDQALTWVTVDHALLGQFDVGVVYDPPIPARPTNVYTYINTGDPGDPGEDEMCEVMDVRESCVSDRSVWHLLSEAAIDELASLVVEEMERQAKQRQAQQWKQAA